MHSHSYPDEWEYVHWEYVNIWHAIVHWGYVNIRHAVVDWDVFDLFRSYVFYISFGRVLSRITGYNNAFTRFLSLFIERNYCLCPYYMCGRTTGETFSFVENKIIVV